MFPDDETLIARGKYSTLKQEREKQLKRAQGVYASIVSSAHAALRDCEMTPPQNEEHIKAIEKYIVNINDARNRLVDLGNQLVDLKPIAWPQ